MTETTLKPQQAFGTGAILQVVHAEYSTATNSASATPVDTGLSATITPSSTSSKILVLVKTGELKSSTSNIGARVMLLRNTTSIAEITKYACYPTASMRVYSSCNYLDSPATTSAVTYKTQINLQVGTGTVTHCEDSTKSYMTLMEIAG